jgi:hypothetical protein
MHLCFGRIAVSRARSLLAYLYDMPPRSLRSSLRFIPQNEFLAAPLRKNQDYVAEGIYQQLH